MQLINHAKPTGLNPIILLQHTRCSGYMKSVMQTMSQQTTTKKRTENVQKTMYKIQVSM